MMMCVYRTTLAARARPSGTASETASKPGRGAAERVASLVTLLLVFSFTTVRVQAQSEVEEHKVKAAFIYHFAQLVDWPAGALGDGSQPMNLCTVGDDPFRGELENSVEGKVADLHVMRVRHLKKIQEAHDCQILFISKSEEKQLAEILMELGNAAVLTIGESDRFAQQGGMIQLTLDDNKVRFNINVGAAQKSGLKISSKLLLLAKEVTGNRGVN